MQCPKCNTENRLGAKFCVDCGAILALVCSECGTELPAAAKFCDACGAQVTGLPSQVEEEPGVPGLDKAIQRLVPREFAERLLATRGQVQAERRMVTILFSDVKGSTAMAEALDPEDVMEIMDGAFDVLIAPIYRYEGTLARLMGDAILAFFGAPIAHEDDPERACRAALEIVEGAQAYAERLEGDRGIAGFNVRVGINTGLVVVGEVGSDLRVEYTAMGDAINLAARMERAAEPGTVLITEDTQKLIAALFETKAMGPIDVRGKAEPVPVYRVLAPKDVPRKTRGRGGLESPLVGREVELGALQEAIEGLQAGVGGIVTVVGEAGIGKSRLVAELRKLNRGKVSEPSQVLAAPHWVEGRCLSYGASVAYLLWSDVLRGLLGVTAEDSPTSISRSLRERVDMLCPEQMRDEVYLHLACLLSLPLTPGEETPLQHLKGERLKAATFRAVETLIHCAASKHPLVLVCEDTHWADPTSMELLEQLLALTDRAPLLFICVFRPHVEHGSWRIMETAARLYRHRHTNLWLDPLSPVESHTLVGNLLQLPSLPESFQDAILRYAEGNPLYVEEIIRSLIASGGLVRTEVGSSWRATRDLTAISIPDTLHGVLTSRIDRLEQEAKRVLQMAAVIGRGFLYRVLAAIAATEAIAWDKRGLEVHLLTLQREEMIRERARIPELEYIFKHEMTREAAYNGLLKRERRVFHCQVAEALERLFPERIEAQLGLLAHHWEQAGVPRKAAEFLRRAGDQARLAYANEEAIGYYRRAVAVLDASREQECPREWRQEVAARVCEGLGDVLQWTGQFDRARAAYQDALAQAPEDCAMWRARLHRRTGGTWRRQRRYEEALRAYDLAQTALDAEPTQPTQEWWREWVQVGIARMWTHYWLAQWHEIAELAEKVRPAVEQHGTLLHRSRFFSALALMAFRRDRYVVSEETLGYSEAALAASQELGDLATITRAQFEVGFAQLWLGDLDKAEENLQESLTLAERTGDVTRQARCLTYLTIVCRKRGQVQETCRYISRSLPVATAAQMPEYLASAKANQAWVSWREENLAEAEQSGRAALELWQQMSLVYPFQWSALWPLMATTLAEDRISDAVGHARALLEPTQQRLPDPLTRRLKEAIRAWNGGELQAARVCLDQSVEVAQEMGYL